MVLRSAVWCDIPQNMGKHTTLICIPTLEFHVHTCAHSHTHKTDLAVYPLNSISLFALHLLIKCIHIPCMFVRALLYMHREENQLDATE